MRTICLWPLSFAVSCAVAATAAADEGMWTFDNFPSAAVEQRYGVEIDEAWLERIRLSIVRLSGCTASFVSEEGLILTNAHCVQGCLAQHSSREQSLIETGYVAADRSRELACSTQIADVLMQMQDVTDEVTAATLGMEDMAANEARKQALTQLEQTCEETAERAGAPLKCQAVTLYDGGQYFLYKYRRYDDVRLVFTPEAGIAAFGGDPDNFQFPRWCLDMALLRAYVDDRPASTPNHLTIDFEGPDEGEPVFVAGHPGSTDRLLTVAQLKNIRDQNLPPALLRGSELRGRYIQFAKTGESAERIVRDALNGLENTIKVQRRRLDALHDDEMLAVKSAAEAQLRARVAADRPLSEEIGDPWARIEAALGVQAAFGRPHTFIEGGAGFNSRLFRSARLLVRAAAERPKENTQRLREFADAALPRLEQQLAAAVPVYPELEELTLSFSLERMREWLGPDAPIVRQLLTAESPDSLAASLVRGSSLGDPAARMALWNGGQAAIDASSDPMILLAKSIDEQARALRKRYEDEVEAVIDAASEAIAKARFAIYGTGVYPDATFTLRLNAGSVEGWVENGAAVEPFTQLGRLYERATGQFPFALPANWQEARGGLDPRTRFNLVSTNDIVGGNSGSPLLDASGAIVGLVFDGNIHSISGGYWFDAERNRAVAVHPAIMREALTKVYQAEHLLEELGISY
jgi:hypothetical protein